MESNRWQQARHRHVRAQLSKFPMMIAERVGNHYMATLAIARQLLALVRSSGNSTQYQKEIEYCVQKIKQNYQDSFGAEPTWDQPELNVKVKRLRELLQMAKGLKVDEDSPASVQDLLAALKDLEDMLPQDHHLADIPNLSCGC